MSTDVMLSPAWSLASAASGDAALVSDQGDLLQEIALAAGTAQGELIWDPDFGWSLIEFIQRDDDEMLRMEIAQRIKDSLAAWDEVDQSSIEISFSQSAGGQLRIAVQWRFFTAAEL